jgi:hypothetical protein
MGIIQPYQNDLNAKLKLIKTSNDFDEMLKLVEDYIRLDSELRQLDDYDEEKTPNSTLVKIQDEIEIKIKSYEQDIKTVRESIDSGENEHTEETIEYLDKCWNVLVWRSNAIGMLINHKNSIQDE